MKIMQDGPQESNRNEKDKLKTIAYATHQTAFEDSDKDELVDVIPSLVISQGQFTSIPDSRNKSLIECRSQMSVKARVSTGVFMNENDLISSYQEPS
jgi:hypothetical protein